MNEIPEEDQPVKADKAAPMAAAMMVHASVSPNPITATADTNKE